MKQYPVRAHLHGADQGSEPVKREIGRDDPPDSGRNAACSAFEKRSSTGGHHCVARTLVEIRICPDRRLEHLWEVIPVFRVIIVRI